MKKRYRIITSLILVTLLVTALAAPAIAAEVTDFQGSGTKNGYSYNVRVYHNETQGIATMNFYSGSSILTAKSQNKIYDSLNGRFDYSELVTQMNYITVTATSTNVFEYNGYFFDGDIQETYGEFLFGETQIVTTFP